MCPASPSPACVWLTVWIITKDCPISQLRRKTREPSTGDEKEEVSPKQTPPTLSSYCPTVLLSFQHVSSPTTTRPCMMGPWLPPFSCKFPPSRAFHDSSPAPPRLASGPYTCFYLCLWRSSILSLLVSQCLTCGGWMDRRLNRVNAISNPPQDTSLHSPTLP